jgi:hypothetical protein
MKTFRNLAYVFLALTALALAMLPALREESPRNAGIAVFAAALVASVASLVMYFHAKNAAVTVLKRRGGRVYGELLQHKMKLIDVLDGVKPLAEWGDFLYSGADFPRIKKFLDEEYFLLLNYEPFLVNSPSAKAVNVFSGMHKELENFIRSVLFDHNEYVKFRRLFRKVRQQGVAPDTPEAEFAVPPLKEAHDALYLAHEYALLHVETLLAALDGRLTALDGRFRAGVPWSAAKPGYDAEYRKWLTPAGRLTASGQAAPVWRP